MCRGANAARGEGAQPSMITGCQRAHRSALQPRPQAPDIDWQSGTEWNVEQRNKRGLIRGRRRYRSVAQGNLFGRGIVCSYAVIGRITCALEQCRCLYSSMLPPRSIKFADLGLSIFFAISVLLNELFVRK